MTWPIRRKGRLGSTRVPYEHGTFASKLEASVYTILKARLNAGEFTEIKTQVHCYLTKARIGYIPDFRCTLKNGDFLFVEAKGFANDVWPIKKKLWAHYGEAPLEIWRGTYKRPFMDELIIPKIHREDGPGSTNSPFP